MHWGEGQSRAAEELLQEWVGGLVWRWDLRTDPWVSFKYLKKAHRWVDRFCGAPMDRSRVRCSKEKYFHWAWGRILANVRASHLRLLWKAGVARCWRRPSKGFWRWLSPQTLWHCVMVLEHCSMERLQQDHLGVMQNKQLHPRPTKPTSQRGEAKRFLFWTSAFRYCGVQSGFRATGT